MSARIRVIVLFVALSLSLYCASFSVFAEEITAYFQFDSMTLDSFVILNEDGTIREVEEKGIVGVTVDNGSSFLFSNAVSGAYWPSVPGDLVCAHVSFDGNFDRSMEPGKTYQYVRVSFTFTVSLGSGFDNIWHDAFQTQVYLDLLDGALFRRFDEYSLSILDVNTYDLSFYGEIPASNTFDYLRCEGGNLSFPASFLDFYQTGGYPDLAVFNLQNSLMLTYIESDSSGGGDSGGGDTGGGDTGGGDTGGGDTGGGDTGGGSDDSECNTIIVGRLDNIETILKDTQDRLGDVKTQVIIQNQMISELPDNIADKVTDGLVNANLGTLPEPDHHEDEIGQVEELEDKFYGVVDDFKENINSSMGTANTVIRDNTDNISAGTGLFLTRVFDLGFIRTLVLTSLGFGFIGYLFRLGGKIL